MKDEFGRQSFSLVVSISIHLRQQQRDSSPAIIAGQPNSKLNLARRKLFFKLQSSDVTLLGHFLLCTLATAPLLKVVIFLLNVERIGESRQSTGIFQFVSLQYKCKTDKGICLFSDCREIRPDSKTSTTTTKALLFPLISWNWLETILSFANNASEFLFL